jgi:hypothetical protein
MKLRSWAALTGVSALGFACNGTTTLGIGFGGDGGAGGSTDTNLGGGLSVAGAVAQNTGGRSGNVTSAGGESSGGGEAVASGGDEAVASGGAAEEESAGGGQGPILVEVGPQQHASKLDVLFVVDNSPGMATKQALLAASLPSFVARLLNPRCVDAQGVPVATQPASGEAACTAGTREFAPVTDLHLGAITTSLGSAGGQVCSTGLHVDDHAQLLARSRGVPTYRDSGFLSYDRAGQTGVSDVEALSSDAQALILAAGQDGCGYEQPLEAMYRFLIDPAPPVSIQVSAGLSTSTGVNQEILNQRAAFLRPDSSLSIVILSDENDCSIADTGVGWLIGATMRLPAATTACATDPNGACCRSCATAEPSPPPGCAPLATDPTCSNVAPGQGYATVDMLHDSLNLRCFNQKSRFGFDLLYPIERYSAGLTNPQIFDRQGNLVANPLFAPRDGKPVRSASLIRVSLIVGAPWTDLASDSSLTSPDLSYLDAAALGAKQRFSLLVGDANDHTGPSDPLMIEAITPRTGTSPLTGLALAPPESTSPLTNSENGHEFRVPDLDQLQYACTFALTTPVTCAAGDAACACSASRDGDTSAVVSENSPLCQPPAGGPAGTTQYYDKGNPGTRELLLARALGNRATPASICPKAVSSATSSNFGYVPALNALVTSIGSTLQSQ